MAAGRRVPPPRRPSLLASWCAAPTAQPVLTAPCRGMAQRQRRPRRAARLVHVSSPDAARGDGLGRSLGANRRDRGRRSLGGAGIPLKRTNPQRYNSLAHPGDAFAYDIFTQAGRAALEPAGAGILGPLTARRTIAAGASQSAIFLVTYVNAVDPLAKVFDGFLVHGRGGTGAGIDGEFIPSSRRGSVNVSGDEPQFLPAPSASATMSGCRS